MQRLKGKTILIGRKSDDSRLAIFVQPDNKAGVTGEPGSVPRSVSRCIPDTGAAHAKIVVNQDLTMTIHNLKEENCTFVNGLPIATKTIVETDSVALGGNRFNISLPEVLNVAKKILGPVPEQPYNISHLQRVWDEYQEELDRINTKRQNSAKQRTLPIIIAMAAGVLGSLVGFVWKNETLGSIIGGVGVAIAIILHIKNYTTKDTSREETKIANENFQDLYVCPKCGRFHGAMSYKLLKQQYGMKCPGCKCNYVEK